MIPHVIARPSTSTGLRFEYDFDAETTTIHRVEVAADGTITQTEAKTVDVLLRHCAAGPDAWYAATMPVRNFGQPAYVETWDWDTLERRSAMAIPFERFGLTAMGVSSDGALALVDRLFHDPEEEGDDSAAVLDLTTETFVAHCRPVYSTVAAPAFSADNRRVMLLHLDQGGAEARVYALDGDPPTLLGEFAHDQLFDDSSNGALRPVGDGFGVWSLHIWDAGGEFCVYDAEFNPRFEPVEFEGEAEEGQIEVQVSNTDFAFVTTDEHAWIGGASALHRVKLDDGSLETTELDLEGVVFQVVRFGDHLVAVSRHGELAAVLLK